MSVNTFVATARGVLDGDANTSLAPPAFPLSSQRMEVMLEDGDAMMGRCGDDVMFAIRPAGGRIIYGEDGFIR